MTKPIPLSQHLLQSASVSIKSAGRLHMGFFDLHGGLGRKFGSIGLALDAPALQINAFASQQTRVIGKSAERAEKILSILMKALALSAQQTVHGIEIQIEQHIPEHAGLGSGTQLTLAIGAAVNHIYGLNLNMQEIAQRLHRGNRSGIGIGAFERGGLLIDGGRTVNRQTEITQLPPLLARYDFPEEWRILLIFDTRQPGIHGEEEIAAFKQLPIFSESLAAHLCRHVLMQAMPALMEKDLNAFGQSIQELQAHVGDYFAPAQGGRYASEQVGTVLEYLGQAGVACYGQSSWGPTGFAVLANQAEAERYLLQLQSRFTDPALGWQICGARNCPANIVLRASRSMNV